MLAVLATMLLGNKQWRKFGLKIGGPSSRCTYKVGVRHPTPKRVGGPDPAVPLKLRLWQ